MMDKVKEQQRKVQQREMLKESYEKQMKLREERGRVEKEMERGYQRQLSEHQEYQEQKRLADLARIYNRVSYNAVPFDSGRYESRRRIRTEVREEDSSRNINASLDPRVGTAQ